MDSPAPTPPSSWEMERVTTNANRPYSVFAIDIDNDGDIDLCASGDGFVAWYENDGGSPPSWTTHKVTTSADGANSVFAIDVDNDGNIDVCSASYIGTIDDIAW